jgi:hypothetical protein
VDDASHRLRFPRFAAQDGEMLAFAHIPTGTHQQPGIFKMDLKKRLRQQPLPFRRGTG